MNPLPHSEAALNQTSLTGHHAVVTGAGSGIGAAIAIELARHGACLTLVGRRATTLDATLERLEGTGHGIAVADITDHAAVRVALDGTASERGVVSILINNAGAATSAPAAKTSPELWHEMLSVNLTGTFNCTHAVLPAMQVAGHGRIINIASTAGLVGYAYVSAYCAAKHGVIGYTRALALEVAKQGITVNAVCPGYTDTPLLGGAIDNIVSKTGRSEDEAKLALSSGNPQGRLVSPEDVARTVAWLCLPGSEAIHGQSIAVAGGEVMTG